jgi:hypothetical protein
MNTIPIRSLVTAAAPIAWSVASSESSVAGLSGFRRLKGASGRSYLVSVYPIDSCPDYVDAVVLAVARQAGADPSAVWIGDAGAGGDSFQAILSASAHAGANEVYVHLLASDAASRLVVIRDLDARH